MGAIKINIIFFKTVMNVWMVQLAYVVNIW